MTLPIVLPPTVLGYYLLTLLGTRSGVGETWERAFGSPLVFTQGAAVVAATVSALPFVIRAARAAISNVDARPHEDPDEIRGLLARQVCGVVEWEASMRHMLASGVGAGFEVGPGRVLRGLLKRIDRGFACSGFPD